MAKRKKMEISVISAAIEDPRQAWKIQHTLNDILTITICGVICGADSWEEIESYGASKENWLRTFLGLKNGVPSADTFARVFSLIKPKDFERWFLEWIRSLAEKTNGDIIHIDGKTLRSSYDKKSEKAAIHMVSAWSSANGCVLGQLKTGEKSNEITAIPELLKVLELKGCIVTIDAMGTQKKIAEQIVDKGGDYALAVKGNQGALFDEVSGFFNAAAENGFRGVEHTFFEETDKGHGRVERRGYWAVEDIGWMKSAGDWKDLRMIGMAESTRTAAGKTTVERRYFISSMEGDAKTFARACRKHWGIENSLHWCLDIAFREDECRARMGFSAENLAVVRHTALCLLRNEKSSRRGLKAKRMRAGWNNDYLEEVLKINFNF
jgi:predicted transposase YbfD/YdcC